MLFGDCSWCSLLSLVVFVVCWSLPFVVGCLWRAVWSLAFVAYVCCLFVVIDRALVVHCLRAVVCVCLLSVVVDFV